MEGEINNFVMVWTIVLASLIYCQAIGKSIPKGISRLLFILPIICIFLLLPLNLTTIHLCGLTSFFISWLANFKLLLFAFGKGPLYANPPIPLSRFIPMACLPIKFQHHKPLNNEIKENPNRQITKKGHKSPLNYLTKIMLLVVLVKVYDYKEQIHQKVRLLLYCLHMYIMLEVLLAMFAGMVRALVRVDLEPQFDEPYLATSLQDFWGKRWNLMVSSILRPTVYDPVRSIATRVMPRRWAPLPATLATFLVSGIMHEVVFYHIGRQRPTWEVTCYFLVNGACLATELLVKKLVDGRFRLPAVVSGPLALAFVVVTTFWLFFPPFLRCNPDVKGCTESLAFIEFIRHGRLISPTDISCPFL